MREDAAEVVDAHAVGFTPMKGTRHLGQPTAEFDAQGPIGDRRFCLVDVEPARVLRTMQNPTLLAVTARMLGSELAITLPDGSRVSAAPMLSGDVLTCDYWGRSVDLALTNGPHAELLSSFLGRPVRMTEAPRGSIVFGRPLTVVTTASIAEVAVRADHPNLLADAARFRATLLVDTDVPFVEETWVGREMVVRIGTVDGGAGGLGIGVRIRFGAPVPRCAVIDLDPVTGERNARLLKTLAATRDANAAGEPFFGVYAEVVEPSVR